MVGQAVGLGVVLTDDQVREVFFCNELDQFLVQPVVVLVQGNVFPLQIHGNQGLDFFVQGMVIGQALELFVHVDGPGHEMPLVPPVREHMVADQQPGDDAVQVYCLSG